MPHPHDNEKFQLYNLDVSIVATSKPFICSHQEGHAFDVIGENIVFKKGAKFSQYALSALLPLLPAKQRETHPNDWMTSDAEIACPDPHCGAIFRITRNGKTTFSRSQTTITPHPSWRK